ncbi:MAG: bifunctional metallophosphatase/5'-nucleotidase [Thermoleophilaceae bacterium]|nr:bifunctional metallophosphatase/5'-nucleotidase [Thermoleophilaceae bacterium]
MRPRLRDRRHLAPGVAAFAAATLVALLGLYARADSPEQATGLVKLRLLGINDLHGHVEPPAEGLGGAAWLAAGLDRATIPGRTIKVHAGDLVGASPLASAYFHDEPSIEVANEIGFDVATLGNHEFDEGVGELRRLLDGSPGFAGARFPYTSANVTDADGNLLLRPYEIVERAGVRIGFIGVTTPTATRYLLPRYSGGLRFGDMSDAVNRQVPELRRRGVEAIVVLAHSGAPTQVGDGARASGQVVDEVRQMSDAVDVVVAGHSHTELNLRIPNQSGGGHKLVVESLSYGTAFDQVDMTLDRATGDVIAKRAVIPRTLHSGLAPDARVERLLSGYRERLRPLADRVVGQAAGPLSAATGLGGIAAEAQRAFAKADVALVDAGSFRARIDAGPITYAELFATQAYDHPLVRMELSGRELRGVLDDGLYTAGARDLDPDRAYSVVANVLLTDAGPYPVLRRAARRGRELGSQVEALAAYVETLAGPIRPTRAEPVQPVSTPSYVCLIPA